ncbi:hypothetical protein BX616_007595, partial [Lobosporangium transversale]
TEFSITATPVDTENSSSSTHIHKDTSIGTGTGTNFHGYLYTLDISRIQRLLRPIKAKLAALHLEIKSSPSLGLTPPLTPSNVTDSTIESSSTYESDYDGNYSIDDNSNNYQSFPQNHQKNPRHPMSFTRSSRNYYLQQKQRQQQQQQDRCHRYVSSSPSSPPFLRLILLGDETNPKGSKSDLQAKINGLVKRFQSSFQNQFKDVVEKVWWQPFCENHNLPFTSNENVFSEVGYTPCSTLTLGAISAFSIGRIVARIPDSNSILVERYYSVMPAYMRRFALLEHLVELCITQIPIGNLILPLVNICVRYRADYQ